jgi:hypothetical protein
MADAEDVRRIALSLPGTIQNGDAFEVNGKGFTWPLREKVEGQRGRVERPGVIAVRVADIWEKEGLLAANSEAFFSTPHYNGYPAVLVRLAVIDVEELTELLISGWRTRAPRKLIAEFDSKDSFPPPERK